ncbi:MAG: MarR family transcriptional regulator [Clostridia bacterium]|nr:MarR family transcriptional regulator [Clostridia bacterium]
MVIRFEEFTSNIFSAYKSILKIKSYVMGKYGLKASHAMCLFFLGKNSEGLSAGELCDICDLDKSAISKVLSTLKDKQYICTNDEDTSTKKYKLKYHITESGMKICELMNAFISKAVEKCGEGISEESRNIFYSSLKSIVGNLDNFYMELENESI